MEKARGDKPDFLRAKWERYLAMIENFDLWRDKEKRAFLATPREEFSRARDAGRSYAHSFLDIGCGVTISGPHIVGRMTSELDVRPADKVLEIGTGSGYQAALLSYLTPHVYSVEIIPPLSEATDRILTRLSAAKYPEYGRIRRKTADGYFGWPEHAPFAKIIVTAGIDHIPPPLLKQLAEGGTMVIPVGPPGAQSLLKLTKTRSETGRVRIERHDIYAAKCSRAEKQRCKRKVNFVALTKYQGGRTVSRWGGN
ncbi:MAG: protein-L-isoaspartate O-methyltransferase [Rhodospirillaceae bacterium]|nr:protein-L-isoaspartate O-methyltransferase [Rhodospirillaceae bacterium]